MRRALPFVAGLALSACAMQPDSYVGTVGGPSEAQTIANGITDFAAAHLSPGKLVLAPIPGDQAQNAVTPALVRSLQAAGFTVEAKPDKDAHALQYVVTPLDTGDLLRITLDQDIMGARFFTNDGGRLIADNPFTVRIADGAGQ